jgi:uncharacterized membrane protein YfhO
VIVNDFTTEAPDLCLGNGTASVDRVSEQPDRMVFEVAAPNAGWLVIADTWYPGWQASVDGTGVDLYQADGLFRAVAVGDGKHKVEMKYRPAGFYFGGMFSILILVLIFVDSMLIRQGRKSV